MINKLAIPVAFILLIIVGLVRANPGDKEAIELYHEQVAEIINHTPVDINGWIGEQVPIPQAATNLLRPNALVARRYLHDEQGVSATLLIVQCRDTRDMAGHYPPRCYPANGWMESGINPVSMFSSSEYALRQYGFHRVAGKVERDISVYSLFILPNGLQTVSMKDVRKLSADYEYRKYGAAQLQVVIDGQVDPELRKWILDEMIVIAQPAIDAVLNSQVDQNDGEGSNP